MNTSNSIILILFFYTSLFSQIPSGYYNDAENTSEQELKAALHNIIDNHQTYNYSSTTDILRESDVDPNDQRNVILWDSSVDITDEAIDMINRIYEY